MRERIANYIRSGHAGLYLVSPEEARVEGELKGIAGALSYGLFAWSETEGLVDTRDGTVRQAQGPIEAVSALSELPENSLLLLRDFHLFLQDPPPLLVRTIKDELVKAKAKGKCVIVLGCRPILPPELEREFVVLDYRLPSAETLGTVLDGICGSAKLPVPADNERDRILEAAAGLTCLEAENAFALSVVECRGIEPGIVAREKAATVKKNGLLEVVLVRETLDDIGGLDVLKDWLVTRKDAFSQRALIMACRRRVGC